jgi:hypothetical protein
MFTFYIGLMLGTSFGFLIGAMMTRAKYADERMEREQEGAADRNMKQVERETLENLSGEKSQHETIRPTLGMIGGETSANATRRGAILAGSAAKAAPRRFPR